MAHIRELNGKFGKISKEDVARASNYLVLTGKDSTDYNSIVMLELLREEVLSGVSNDISKYNVCESYKTSLSFTINARSLQNFLSLRSSPQALWEIRNLANAIFDSLPEDYIYLFEDSMYQSDV